jgi:hypothetical protein
LLGQGNAPKFLQFLTRDSKETYNESVYKAPLIFATSFALAISVLFTVPANAVPVIDQQSSGSVNRVTSSTSTNQIGQSFTAGRTGALTRLDLSSVFTGGSNIISLTVRIYATSSGLPIGSPIASEVIPQADVPVNGTGAQMTVTFTSPANVIAGQQYAFALVPQASLLQIELVDPATYAGGQTLDNGPSSWATVSGAANPDLVFATYVDSGPITEQFTPQNFELSLNSTDGSSCLRTSQLGREGTWLTLPGAPDCTPPASKAGATLLGWSTEPNFPLSIAQRQVTNGWGTYETFNTAGTITSVFIPAGRATFLSGTNTLYPIWSK